MENPSKVLHVMQNTWESAFVLDTTNIHGIFDNPILRAPKQVIRLRFRNYIGPVRLPKQTLWVRSSPMLLNYKPTVCIQHEQINLWYRTMLYFLVRDFNKRLHVAWSRMKEENPKTLCHSALIKRSHAVLHIKSWLSSTVLHNLRSDGLF